MNKKILLVTRNFPPLIGGMEKLNLNIYNSLCSNFSVSFSGPEGSSKFHKSHDFIEFSSRPLWRYLISSLFNTTKLANKVKPDVVFCGSGAAILAGYVSAKLTGAKLVCYLHGLDIVAKNIVYQLIFIPLIKKSHLLFVNSQHTRLLALQAGFDSQLIKILSPGTSIPLSADRKNLERQFRNQHNLQDIPFLLIAGRITKRKGIEEFIVNVMPELIYKYPQLKLVIIGDEATQAIKHQDGVKEKIIQTINSLGLQKNVDMLGNVNDATLSAAFFSAKMLVFPVLNLPNDVEGFGMIAIEAASHGLPSVGFEVGGVADAVASGISGWLMAPNQYDQMRDIIFNYLSHGQECEVTSESCIDFARQFEWEKFGEKLNTILTEELL